MIGRLAAGCMIVALCPLPAQAQARPIDLAGALTLDLARATAGDGDRRLRALTNLDLTADADLDALLGWQGGKAHAYVLDNRGARPNDAATTLQGVDNIEVSQAGLRLFEAWIEQDIGPTTTLRAGLYDLNSEFYTNPAASLLIAPPFGIGSELAATGPNGPSIFPSSALTLRLRTTAAAGKAYAQLAAVNARASTLGDHAGVDFSFREGLLLIGEAGITGGPLRGSIGLWHYTRPRDDLFETDAAGLPTRRASQGAYAVIEGDLLRSGARQLTGFVRAGLSDPHTSPFTGGLQTGLLVTPALATRPKSALSLGMHHAWTTRHFRDALAAQGSAPARGETALELTYADEVVPGLTLQPDVQWIFQPGGNAAAADSAVATLRMVYAF